MAMVTQWWDTRRKQPEPAPAMPESPSASSRRIGWDILRVAAVGEVVVFHMSFLGPATKPGIPPAPFAWTHPCGASVLLVLSGYFAAVTVRKHAPLRWLARRLARLLPAYFVAVAVTFALVRLLGPEDLDLHHLTLTDLAGNLLLLQQLLPGHVRFVDVSFWTLPVQVAGFAAIALLARLRPLRDHALVVLWAAVAAPLLIRWTWMADNPPTWLVLAIEGTGLARAHLLVAGVAIWMWANRRISAVHLATLLTATLVAHKVHPPYGNSPMLLGVVLLLICLAAKSRDWAAAGTLPIPAPRWPARSIQWLAGCSYGVYLMHQSIGYLVEELLAQRGVDPRIWLAAAIATAVALGWALTVYVERPAFAWITRRLDR
ncbi:MAG: acyltransferase [Mycobacteriaceae bacterium]|nr:acyltransferase [Mycobacteriaceae bacterium]